MDRMSSDSKNNSGFFAHYLTVKSKNQRILTLDQKLRVIKRCIAEVEYTGSGDIGILNRHQDYSVECNDLFKIGLFKTLSIFTKNKDPVLETDQFSCIKNSRKIKISTSECNLIGSLSIVSTA